MYITYRQMNARTNSQMMIQRHLAGELFGYLSALNNFKVDMIIIEVPFCTSLSLTINCGLTIKA